MERTPALEAVIGEYHKYYLKADYRYFLVLTQSCDLVRRSGNVAAPYLSICAVRPLPLVLAREAGQYQKGLIQQKTNAISTKHRERLKSFVASLLNNNNKEMFYLHEQPDVGLSGPHCAFLRLTVAVRTDEHYDKFLGARILSAHGTFQPKLGWLVGNIYSRVGTSDWTPDYRTAKEWEEHLNKTLDEYFTWVEEDQLKQARRNLTEEQIRDLSPEEIISRIRSTETVHRRQEVIDVIMTELRSADLADENSKEKARKRLLGLASLAALVK